MKSLLPLLLYQASAVIASISPTFLVENKGHEIKLIDHTGSRVLVSRLEYNIAMDVDMEWNLVFYVNDQDKLIIFHIDRPENQFVTSIEINELTDCLCVDWISKIVYWSDRETQRLEMASYAQYKSENIVQQNLPRVPIIYQGLYHISHLCIDPEKRYLFFVHYFDYTTIERTNLDGSNRTVVFDLQNQEALSMTLDRRRLQIYFAANDNIFSIDYDHNSLIKPNRIFDVVRNAGMVETLTLDKDYLYWANQSGLFYVSLKGRPSKVNRLNFPIDAEPLIIRIMDASAKKMASKLDRRKYPCLIDNGRCSHICIHASDAPFGRKCFCPTGFRLINQTTCAEKISKILLLAQRSELRMISLDTNDYTDQRLSITPKNAIAVDYDYLNNEIYYSDGDLRTINCAKLNQKKEDVEIVVEDAGYSDGVVIDWVSRNLYWTDNAKYRIGVMNIDKKFLRIIVSSGLNKPRAIVVDPKRGYLYWSDWREDDPKIERSFLDGSNREIIATFARGSYPNGLSLDIENNYLYYVDAKNDKIVRFNASNIADSVVLQKQEEFHIFGFTMLNDYIYLSDWVKRRLIKMDRNSKNGDLFVLRDNLADLMGIKAIDLENPPGIVCSCPSHLDLSDDGKNCVVSRGCIIYVKSETSSNITPSSVSKQSLMKQCLDYKIFNPYAIPYTISDGALVSGDYSWKTQTMYWIYKEDSDFVSIKEIDFNGTDRNNIDNGISPVEGIAIDWISSNLYFSDSFYNSIQVMHMVHRRRRVLIWRNIAPRQLVVHPRGNALFWVDRGFNGRPSLKKSDLAGYDIEDLYCDDYVFNRRILSLVIDRESNILYFADSKNIFSVDWRNRYCRMLTMDGHSEPMSLALYHGKLLWVNKLDTKLRICSTNEMCSTEDLFYNSSTSMISMMAVYDEEQKNAKEVSNACRESRSHACYDLCLPSVASGALCACATHYLTMSSDDCARTRVFRLILAPRSFLLFSQRETIYRTVIEDTNAYLEAYSTYGGPPPILLLRNKSLAMPLVLLAYDPRLERIIWISADDYDENTYWLHMSSDAQEAASRNSVMTNSVFGELYWLRADAVKFLVGSEIVHAVHDPFTSSVFWIENSTHYSVMASRLDQIHQSESHFRLLNNPDAEIVDLSIDGRRRLLYYVDKSRMSLQLEKKSNDKQYLSRHTIYVCQLFEFSKRLSQFGLPCTIFRENIDGPMSLFTVDSISGSVVWVESPMVNGKQKTVINKIDSLSHSSRFDMGYDIDLLALTVHDKRIFFVRFDQNSSPYSSDEVDSVKKIRRGRLEFMPLDFAQDYEKGVVLMHYVLIDEVPKLWPMSEDIFVGAKVSPCPSPHCSHFCWPVSMSSKSIATNGYECGCPVDMILSSNNKTCGNRVPCQPNQFLCNDGQKCVDYDKLCNLHDDCADKSDESDLLCDCSTDPSDWQRDKLYSSNLLSRSSLLDDRPGIPKNGWKSSRPQNKYRCGNHRHVCIDKSKFCDNVTDCPDRYDEIGCDCPRKIMCQRDEIGVLTICLNEHLLCDNRNDCYDKLDEICPSDRIPHGIAPTTWGLIIIAMFTYTAKVLFIAVALLVAYFTCRSSKNDAGPMTTIINQRTNNVNNVHLNFLDNSSCMNEPRTLSTVIEMRTRIDTDQNNEDIGSRIKTRTNSDSMGNRSATRMSVSSNSASDVSSGIHRRPVFHYCSSNDENMQHSPPKLPSLASGYTKMSTQKKSTFSFNGPLKLWEPVTPAPKLSSGSLPDVELRYMYATDACRNVKSNRVSSVRDSTNSRLSIHVVQHGRPPHKPRKKHHVRRHRMQTPNSPPPGYYQVVTQPHVPHLSETTTLLYENTCSTTTEAAPCTSNRARIAGDSPAKLPPPAPPNSCFDVEESDDLDDMYHCDDCKRKEMI
uniref:EGF-like domain-containing protein n=1 Tax=Romanomermis culicivorax TaxID=13658 RepID=A0A915HHT8_ROMCU